MELLHPNRTWNHPGNHPPPSRTRSGTLLACPALLTVGGRAVGEFFTGLGSGWSLSRAQQSRLAPLVSAALGSGWTPEGLARFAGANTVGIRSPYAVLAARLSPTELPPPGGPGPARPDWCGKCDQRTRMQGFDGDAPMPCPRCRPVGGRRLPARP